MHNRHRHYRRDIANLLNNKIFFAVFLAFISLIFLFKYRSFFLFLVICIISAAINYFIHTTNFHLHLGHVSFFAVIFSYTLGWQFGIAMIIIAHILAELVAGHADIELFNTALIYIISVFIAFSLRGTDIVVLGIGLTVFQVIATSLLGFFTGTPLFEIITEDGLEFIMLLFYYTAISRGIVGFIG